MIDENKTFELFRHTSDMLKPHSHKKVLRICDICKEESLVHYGKCTDLCFKCALQQKNQSGKNHPFYGKHHSEETKLKMSKNKQGMYDGDKNPMYDKKHSKETKQKISNSMKGKYCGKNHPMHGKHHSNETKLKMSKRKQGKYYGKNNPRWKGGEKMSRARRRSKRRQLFGFIPHNKPQENFHGHHLDFNHVIFIPKELHISISHSVVNDKNMNLINDAVCDWYLKDQISIKLEQ